MTKPIDLSVVIVNYNTKEHLRECLRSVVQADIKSVSIEVIVSDNGSTDLSRDMVREEFPFVFFIENGKNLGFSKANNIGISKSHGRFILLLNSDTVLSDGLFPRVIQYMDDHDEIGALTCRLDLRDGSLDPACHRGFPTPWNACTYMIGLERLFPTIPFLSGYHLGGRNMSEPHEIDCPSGAFFWVRREVVRAVGGLDETFFMYGEDIDWAFRMKQKGFKIWYVPFVTALHKKKQSGRGHKDTLKRRQTQRYFYETMLLFYSKHLEKRYPKALAILIRFLITVRIRILDTIGV